MNILRLQTSASTAPSTAGWWTATETTATGILNQSRPYPLLLILFPFCTRQIRPRMDGEYPRVLSVLQVLRGLLFGVRVAESRAAARAAAATAAGVQSAPDAVRPVVVLPLHLLLADGDQPRAGRRTATTRIAATFRGLGDECAADGGHWHRAALLLRFAGPRPHPAAL